MKCLFLEGRYIQKCTAVRGIFVPSSFELEEYCRSNRSKICPFYLDLIRKPWENNSAAVPACMGQDEAGRP